MPSPPFNIEIASARLADKDPSAWDLFKEIVLQDPLFKDGQVVAMAINSARIKGSSARFEDVLKVFQKAPSEFNRKLFSWFVYNQYFKGKSDQEVKLYYSLLLNWAEQGDFQQNKRGEADVYPCPFTLSVFKMIKAFQRPAFSTNSITTLLSLIDPDKLSNQATTYSLNGKRVIEDASFLEKYYALKSKCLLELGQYQKLIDLVDEALTSGIIAWHYQNDLWLSMRQALAYQGLRDFEKSVELFSALVAHPAGEDKWFLYFYSAQSFYGLKRYREAWQCSLEAMHFRPEPKFLTDFLLFQAKVLYHLKRPGDSKLIASCLQHILAKEAWPAKLRHQRLFNYHGLNTPAVDGFKRLWNKVSLLWKEERLSSKTEVLGQVIKLNKKATKGLIKGDAGQKFQFQIQDFVQVPKAPLIRLKDRLSFRFFQSMLSNKNWAEHISVINDLKLRLEGKIVNGKLKKVLPFGLIFSFQGLPDGLLHNSQNLKNGVELISPLAIGHSLVKLRIRKQSPKGLELAVP